MRIFLSYAREQAKLANEIAVRLRQEHRVFFDSRSLQPAEGFDAVIRREISRCDLFIFLISPQSVERTGYALTELGLAEKRWPNASGHVLPVMAAETATEQIPPYARSVTFLDREGEVVAGIADEVARIAGKRMRKRIAAGLALVVAVAAAAGIWQVLHSGGGSGELQPCRLSARFEPSASLPPGLHLRITGGGASNDFSVARSGDSEIDVAVSQLPSWTLTAIARDGTTLGSIALDGCPTTVAEYDLDGGIPVEIAPRS